VASSKSSLKYFLWAVVAVAVVVLVFHDLIFHGPAPHVKHIDRELKDSPLMNSKGSEVSLFRIIEESKGKKAIVSLWATWCEPCVKELPLLVANKERIEGNDTIVVLVNYDGGLPDKTIPEVLAWLVSQGIRVETYFDFKGQLLESVETDGLPFTFGLGADKKIQWAELGEIDWADKSISVK